uniref:ARAD1D27170p n=1 Tax=Blastobotrys adeninivorans TaxID=409370 RepID=A0A060TBD7_BLAAD
MATQSIISRDTDSLGRVESFEVESRDAEITLDSKTLRRRGLMVVLAGFMANFTVFGIGFSYGVFQEYYMSGDGPLHDKSTSIVSLIGTIGTALTYLGGILHSPLDRVLSPRNQMLTGSIILSLGLILTGSCSKVYQFMLCQGILFGIGSSMAYLPPVVCGPPYFTKHRGIAMGAVFSGTGFGGLVMAPLARALISAMGFRWALRTLGFMSLVLTGTASFLVFPHPSQTVASHGLVNLRIARSSKFILQCVGSLSQAAAYIVPLFYMSSYGETLGYSSSQGAVFIGVNNAVNAISKIVFGYFADVVGRINMLVFCCIMSTASVFGLWYVPAQSTFVAFVILYGVFSGPIIALLPACLVELFGVQNYQSMSGFMYFTRGVGNLLGSPIAGLFVTKGSSPMNYRGAIIYTGAMLLANSVAFAILRGFVGYEQRKLKA